jgi:hypothetical protein
MTLGQNAKKISLFQLSSTRKAFARQAKMCPLVTGFLFLSRGITSVCLRLAGLPPLAFVQAVELGPAATPFPPAACFEVETIMTVFIRTKQEPPVVTTHFIEFTPRYRPCRSVQT